MTHSYLNRGRAFIQPRPADHLSHAEQARCTKLTGFDMPRDLEPIGPRKGYGYQSCV